MIWESVSYTHLHLNVLYQSGVLKVPISFYKQETSFYWNTFKDSLYQKDWCPYIKETFNGFGNAIEYLGRYTHKVAISNSLIPSPAYRCLNFWYP